MSIASVQTSSVYSFAVVGGPESIVSGTPTMELALLAITQEIRGESSEFSCLYNLVPASKL